MLPTLMLILTLLIVVTALVGVARSLVRMWLDYRVRMAVLDKIESTSESFQSIDQVESVLSSLSEDGISRERSNHLLTGVLTALLGLICIVVGRALRVGPVAVGLDMGGIVCVGIGVIIALVGTASWALSRRRLTSRH